MNSDFIIENDVLAAYNGKGGDVTIPETVTHIGDYAFAVHSFLNSVTIPETVTSIGDYAFAGCSSLNSVTLPNNVTSIGVSAFSGCSSLNYITLPNNVAIGDYAFSECSNKLTTLQIDKSLFNVKSLTKDIDTDITPLVKDYIRCLSPYCINPNSLPKSKLTEEVVDEIINCCIKNKLYENQVWFTNYKHKHFPKSIDETIKHKLSFDDDTIGETSLFQ